MSGEKKSRTRRGRAPRATTASGSGIKQKSIKDMFGGRGSKGTEAEADTQTQDVVYLADPSGAIPLASTPPAEEVPGPPQSVQLCTATTGPPVHKELFPIFQKQSTIAEELPPSSPPASEPDVINIMDDEPPQPKPVRPPKPLHPFFAKSAIVPTQTAVPKIIDVEEEFTEGSSRDAPIIIESSPVRSLTVLPNLRPSKPAHPFFSKPQRVKQNSSNDHATQNILSPPFPDREGQNVTGSLQPFPTLHEAFQRRIQALPKPRDDEPRGSPPEGYLSWLKDGNSSESWLAFKMLSCIKTEQHTLSDAIQTIPRIHRSHPSISRLLHYIDTQTSDTVHNTPQQDLWTDQWRPHCAQEVLGNERHASYLKDWIDALRLQQEQRVNPSETNINVKSKNSKKRKRVKSKRPNIVRHVKKRRKDDYDEDFVVFDDNLLSDEDDMYTTASSDFDDLMFCQETFERLSAKSLPSTQDGSLASPPSDIFVSDTPELSFFTPAQSTRFGSQIRNTILLAGPSGCGKTAAVYACTEQLGWDVFEVYPGIGDRSGAELNKLIGDVGKNHIVKVQHQPSPKKAKPMNAFFQTARGKAAGMRRIDSDDEMDDIDVISFSPPPQGKENTPPDLVADVDSVPIEPTVNQSVILIEEVDVLYQTDTNFWPALINIIKDCRRPVILTCNDVSRVPCLDLPLQTTLHFAPCPAPLAGSYLQALCLAHGLEVQREALLRLYEGIGAEYESTTPDLRRSIMQLQFLVADVKEHMNLEATAPGADAIPPSSTTVPEDALHNDGPTSTCGDVTSRVSPDQERQRAVEFVQMTRVWESISYVDAYLARENSACHQDVFTDVTGPSLDDTLGHKVLFSDVSTDSCPVSLFHQQDRQLEEEVLRLSQRAMPQQLVDDLPITHSTSYTSIARMPHHARVGPILRNLISDSRTRPWRASASEEALYLDYAPWIRYIVAADDALESVSQPSSQTRRSTRNSMKTSHDRWLTLELDDRRTLSETSLRLDWDDSEESS